MQMERAVKLRADWGDKPCDHPDFDKEYVMSMDTGDFICTQCGRMFSRQERDDVLRARDDKRQSKPR